MNHYTLHIVRNRAATTTEAKATATETETASVTSVVGLTTVTESNSSRLLLTYTVLQYSPLMLIPPPKII